MKAIQITLLLSGVLLTQSVIAQQQNSSMDSSALPAARPALQTPAMLQVQSAETQIKADPKKTQAYVELAGALLIRARETGKASYIDDAEAALAKGFKLEPNNFQLRKMRVALLIQEQKYDQAREQAILLNKQTPDDAAVYGYLAEIAIALGDYDAAEKSTQWMLNMLPNNVPGLMLGARLRVVYGDPEGALEFLEQAYAETSPTEVEEQARIANQIATIQIDTGKSNAAEQTLARAQQALPGYPDTLMNSARVRIAQHRNAEAVTLLTQLAESRNDACVQYAMKTAQPTGSQSASGYAADATAHGAGNYEDAKRCVVLIQADNSSTATAALKLAEQLIAVRHDVWTLDAYAWALYSNSQFDKADVAIQKALAVGITNAQIFDHAGRIAQKLGHNTDAQKDFELSLRADPDSPYAADARAAVGHAADPAYTQEATNTVPSTEPRPVANTAGKSASVTPYVRTVDKSSTPHFAPVPEELLTPHPTESARMIRAAQALATADPKNAKALAALGAAYFQRARETADVGDFDLAERSLKASLDIDSTDFEAAAALGAMAEVCMGEHRFTDALKYAQRALSLGSGDVSSFAIVGDAYADMGEYDKAAQAYARLTPPEMTLSPRAAYARDSRISYLKFVSGDTPEAIRLMNVAVAEGTESQIPSENVAWLHYELGEYLTQAGDISGADSAYLAALVIHPGDYRALASLARLRANNGRYDEAIVLYQKAIAVVPMPIFVAELGDVYAKTGNPTEAEKQYRLVEYIGKLGQINQVLHNRDLALFYADHDVKLLEALKLAQKEFEVRHDVYTWDALAWAEYKNGKYEDAQKASQTALKFGTLDALLLYHSGLIEAKIGKQEQAQQQLQEALQINPHFHLNYADDARKNLPSANAIPMSSAGVDGHAR